MPTMRRTNVVKLIVDKNTHEKLKELAMITAKCWNEVNWLRMQQFKKGERVDFARTEKEVYEKYKDILGSANAQQVARMNAEDWRSFFQLTREKREGRLPKWLKPRPPGYWKDEDGDYKLIILIRNDRYVIDEANQVIYLRDFKLALKFKGKLKWRGRQGRLEIQYNDARRAWYAHIPVEVEANAKVEDGLSASVDLGIVNLATVYIEGDSWLLFKGGSVLAQYEYYGRRISSVQKLLARHGQRGSRRLRLLYDKRSRFLKHVFNSMVRMVMSELRNRGVTRLKVGHPKDISRNHGNKLTVGFWNYGYIIRRFKEAGEELGIDVIEINEAYSSKTCTLCGEAHENGRIKRGLYKCPRMGKIINVDLNAAVNILHIPESQGSQHWGLCWVRDRGNGLKTHDPPLDEQSRVGEAH